MIDNELILSEVFPKRYDGQPWVWTTPKSNPNPLVRKKFSPCLSPLEKDNTGIT